MSGEGAHNPYDDTALLANVATLQVGVDDIHDAIEHVSAIFPDDTDLTCTFTAAAGANTWSGWAEIVDSAATTLSSLFVATPGHLSSLTIEEISDTSALYMIEVAYGGARIVTVRARVAGSGKFHSPDTHAKFWAPLIPAGETIYYRMKTDKAVADTCNIHFRYHVH